MEMILLEKINKLGDIGDIVRVKTGFARNFLLPQGKATFATKDNVAVVEKRRAELEKAAAEGLAVAKSRAEAFEKAVVTITQKAGDEGKLFGSVGLRDVADAIQKAGLEVEKSEIRMPEGPIRQLGEFDIALQLHSDVLVTVKLKVDAEE